jgi:hypothetical protein
MNNERIIMVKIRELLRSHHIGKNKAICASRIAFETRVKDGETHPVIRSAITRLILEEHIPIASCCWGYFIIETEDEYKEYLADLIDRELGMRRRSEAIKIGWADEKE